MRSFLGVAFLALIALCLPAHLVRGQEKEKKLLETKGWGSLKGTVTLDGTIPEPADILSLMMKHQDKTCCLDKEAKNDEKIDLSWVVDPKTKGVANVMVWIMPPAYTYFPTHNKLQVRKEVILIDQPHCAYIPRMSAYQPYYLDGGKKVETGQTLVIRNSATVNHNVRAVGSPEKNPGFNVNMIPKSEMKKTFVPQLLPISLQCDIHTWMSAKLFVFDHPYYANTKSDGTFEIPLVPAGAEITIMAWHEKVGYAILKRDGEKFVRGQKMTLKAGENTFDIKISTK